MVSAKRGAGAKKPTKRKRDTGEGMGWQELRTRLKGIADELRRSGLASHVDGLEQVAQLFYLKLLDEQEPVKETRIFSGMTARFRWSSFRDLPAVELHRFVKDHVLSYLASLSIEAPAVADYFRSATVKIEDPEAFKRIVGLIDEIDFERLKPDEMGRILEYLFAETGYAGEFRTPHHLRALMISLVDPEAGESIYDPACGTGGFLTDAVTYMLAKASSAPREMPIYGEDWPRGEGDPPLQTWKVEGGKLGIDRSQVGRLIHGNDISWRMTRIASMNLALQNIGPVDVRRVSSLSNVGGLSSAEMERKYDVILCAPPFGDDLSNDALRSDLPIQSTRLELLFLEIAVERLAPGGRGVILVPESALFSEGSTFVEIRKLLLSTCEVLAVISLPASVFRPYSAVKTSILVFRRPVSKLPRTEHVWFYEIEHDGYDLKRSPQPEKNDIPELLSRWARFAASNYTRPPGLEAANMRKVKEPSHYWWARREVLDENQFNLSAQRYKPRFHDLAWRPINEQIAQLEEGRKAFAIRMEALHSSISGEMLPHGWSQSVHYMKLGELVEVVRETTQSIDEPLLGSKELPWVSLKDMRRYVFGDTQEYVKQSAVENAQAAHVMPGSVLIVVQGAVLMSSVPIAVTFIPLVVSKHVKALYPKKHSGVDAWYLFAYLKSVEDYLLANTRGTVNRFLALETILGLDVPVPSDTICIMIGQVMQNYVRLIDAAERVRRDVNELFPSMLDAIFDR